MSSSITHSIESTSQNDQLLLVNPEGLVYWSHGSVITTQCTIDVRFFPFDTQNCTIEFGSWLYSSSRMNLTIDEKQINYYYKENNVWHTKVSIRRFGVKFPDFPGEFPRVAVELILSRGSFYYVLIIIIPCTLLALINLMVFLLPTESGEKVSLGITNYLALVLTQQLVGELIPPVSDRLPIILCKYKKYLDHSVP